MTGHSERPGPDGGDGEAELDRLTAAAEKRLASMFERFPTYQAAVYAEVQDGIGAFAEALRRHREDGTLPDLAASARLCVALANPWAYLDACARLAQDSRPQDLLLLTTLARCARGRYVSGPAALAACAAIQAGNPGLAREALERALAGSAGQPGHRHAARIRHLMDAGVTVGTLRSALAVLTPEDVASRFLEFLLKAGTPSGRLGAEM